jgi:hypothetical protein
MGENSNAKVGEISNAVDTGTGCTPGCPSGESLCPKFHLSVSRVSSYNKFLFPLLNMLLQFISSYNIL